MARYSVRHNYRSERDGELVGPWLEGQEIDVDDALAAYVNVDSPGALKPTKEAEKAREAAEKEAAEKAAAEAKAKEEADAKAKADADAAAAASKSRATK